MAEIVNHVPGLKKWSINEVHSTCKDDPIIVSFSSNGQLQPEFSEDVKFKKYADCKNSKSLLHAQTTCAAYVGKQAVDSVKYCIGVLNKKTGKMAIYDSSLYNLQPHGLSVVDATEELFKTNEETSWLEKSDRLTETFGSKRKKSQMDARKRHEVETDEMEFMIKKTAAETKTKDIKNTAVNEETIINVNWDADKVSQAYDLNQIISEDEFVAMDDCVTEFKDATEELIQKWRKEETYCPFILHRLKGIGSSEKRSKMLLYLSYLIQLYKLKANEVRKKEPLPNTIPMLIRTKLFNLFTQSSSALNGRVNRTAPTPLKDKLIAFIVVLALMINGFKLDLNLLPDIKIAVNRLSVLLRSIGISVKTGSKVVEVKVPLHRMVEKKVKNRK